MKEILKYTLFGIVLSACMVFGWWIGRKTVHAPQPEHITDSIVICDTITELKPQYITISHFDTVPMEVYINDTVTDTMLVMLPIEKYHYDSTIVDTNYTTRFSASLTGYKLSFDTLCLSTEIMQQHPKNTPKWYTNICPAVGVGYGTGGLGIFLGVGYKIF